MRAIFTTGQVARVCGVSQQAVIKWFDSGRLRGFRIPGSRDRRIPRESLVTFMSEHGIPTSSLETAEEEDRKLESARRQQDELESLRTKTSELTALLEISDSLFQPYELDELLERIMAMSRKFLDAEAASVLLLDKATDKLKFYYVKGGEEQAIQEIILEPGQGIAGWSFQTGQAVLVEDARDDPRFYSEADKKTKFVTRSLICVPMVFEGETIGVVEVLNKNGGGSFLPKDLDLLVVLARQISQAIGNVRRQQRLREQDRFAAIGAMAGAIIHDLKNPMTIIKGFAYLLKRKSPDNEKYCDYISTEIDRLVEMSKELLDFCRGETRCVVIPVSSGDFLREFSEFVREDLLERKIEFKEELAYEGIVHMDPAKIRRVILNLVNNAKEAMDTGGSLTISALLEGQDYVLRVSDSGCGMPPDVCENLFRPFFTHGKERGTGLGLAIVKNIVAAHGGTIGVESTLGKGTTFEIRLPVKGQTEGSASPSSETKTTEAARV